MHEAGIEFHEDAIYWGHEIDTGPCTGDGCGRRRCPPAQAIDTQCMKKRKIMFQIAKVGRTLVSVDKLSETGHTVILNKDSPRIVC